MVAFANTLGLVHFDISPVEGTCADDLDPAKLHVYWQGYYQIPYGDLDRGEQLNILRNADILVPLEEEWTVSVGGLLLFGRASHSDGCPTVRSASWCSMATRSPWNCWTKRN